MAQFGPNARCQLSTVVTDLSGLPGLETRRSRIAPAPTDESARAIINGRRPEAIHQSVYIGKNAMVRTADDTKGRILRAAYELFYRKGFTRVGVDVIAQKAGVTKRTLYYHFKSKDHLLRDVFHFAHELALERIQRWGSGLADELDPMLDSLFLRLADWAAKPRWAGAGFTRVVMELADSPGHPARVVASRHKTAVETWVATEFARRKVASPDERARQVVLLLEGCTSLMLIHGDRRYARAAAEAAKSLVSAERKSR
jgi:AcrR family transcriptional regulator